MTTAVGTLLLLAALCCYLWPWLDAAEDRGSIRPGESQEEIRQRIRRIQQ